MSLSGDAARHLDANLALTNSRAPLPAAAQKYFASDAYKAFRRQVEPLIQAEQVIDYQPTTIQLSEKF